MNHDQTPNDGALLRELRDALSELAMPERPPLAAITHRGRAHRRRLVGGLAGLGVTGAAVGTALALVLTGGLGAAPAPARGAGPSTGSIGTGGFTLTSDANGTLTLTLTMRQMLSPATLQQALANHGIPALVKTDAYCSSSPPPPDPVSIGVLSIRPPAGWPAGSRPRLVPAPSSPAPVSLKEIAARTVTVINPSAIPAGTELFFGYSPSDRALFTDLISTGSYTCHRGQPAYHG